VREVPQRLKPIKRMQIYRRPEGLLHPARSDTKIEWDNQLFLALHFRAAQFPFMVGDIAGAAIGFSEFGGHPAVFALLAGSVQGGALHSDVFAGRQVRSGRQNITGGATKNAVEIDDASGAAVGVFKRCRHFATIIAAADGVECGPSHLNVLTGLLV